MDEQKGFPDSPKSTGSSEGGDAVPKKKTFRMGLPTRKVSALGAKKAVASKIGETKLGRSTLVKVMGSEADEIVGSLKSAVSKIDDHAIAKDLKKDLMKWVLKASVLVQEKRLDKASAEHLAKPAILMTERVIDECERKPRGERDLNKVSEEMKALGPKLRELLEPHSQDKNVDKVERLVNYYSNPEFLHKLFNDAALQEESDLIVANAKSILLPFPSVLNDKATVRAASNRIKSIRAELVDDLDFAMSFDKDHPEIAQLFTSFLDSRDDLKQQAVAFRFLVAEKEFSQISAANLRASRAKVLCSKFLVAGPMPSAAGIQPQTSVEASASASASSSAATAATPPMAPILCSATPSSSASASGSSISINASALDAMEDAVATMKTQRHMFADLRLELQQSLRPAFKSFTTTSIFLKYKQALQSELEDLRATFAERIRESEARAAEQMGSTCGATGATASA